MIKVEGESDFGPQTSAAVPTWGQLQMFGGQWRHRDVMVSQITGNFTVCSPVVYIKKTSKIHVTGPLWGESTRDQGIPFTKGQ